MQLESLIAALLAAGKGKIMVLDDRPIPCGKAAGQALRAPATDRFYLRGPPVASNVIAELGASEDAHDRAHDPGDPSRDDRLGQAREGTGEL